MLCSTMAAWSEAQTYALQVDGLACPFCAFGIEKQLGKIEGVETLDIDIKAGVVLLTMKDGVPLAETAAQQAVKRAGFTLRGLEQVRDTAQDNGENK